MILFTNIYTKEMKNNQQNSITKISRFRYILVSLLVGAFALSFNIAVSQEAKEATSKLTFKMRLSSILSNGIRSVKAELSRNENGKTVAVENLLSPVNLYLAEVKKHDPVTGTGWISKVYINREGEGIFEFPANFNITTSGMHEFTFIAKMESDPLYQNAEKEITISDAKLTIEYEGKDSVKTATACLMEWKGTEYVPVKEGELKLCIKRAFNFLPFGSNGATTDENGKISGELPLDVPGNADGTLTIAARLEDHETFGTLEITKSVPWNILPKVNEVRGRTLWSQGDNAPLLLVISSLTIITIIWGTIIYLIYLLTKIKKFGKTP